MKRSYGFDSHPENQTDFINEKTDPIQDYPTVGPVF